MPAPLLTAHDASGHVHLIIGSNPLASARCAKSIEAGAKPKIVAPADAEVHYALLKRIEDGEVEWIKKGFEDEHLTTLGREEVDNVVDAVFVTLGGKKASSACIRWSFSPGSLDLQIPQALIYRPSAGGGVYQSMLSMLLIFLLSPSSPPTPMVPCR